MSVSTIKRWVDAGVMRASRTVGGHRLISAAEALRFARERGLPAADLESVAGVGAAPIGTIDDRFRDTLDAALVQGSAEEARALILTAHATAGSAVVLADELIGPVMERVGHDWEVGALEVFQEHRASRIVESVLWELNRQAPGPPGTAAPLALGAAPEGDLYTLAGLLCELTLRELGWEAQDLGPNLPLASLARAAYTHRPRLVWLTIHHIGEPERFLCEYDPFFTSASAMGATVILGGPALGPALRGRLRGAAVGDRMVHLAELARRLHPAGGGATDLPGSIPV